MTVLNAGYENLQFISLLLAQALYAQMEKIL